MKLLPQALVDYRSEASDGEKGCGCGILLLLGSFALAFAVGATLGDYMGPPLRDSEQFWRDTTAPLWFSAFCISLTFGFWLTYDLNPGRAALVTRLLISILSIWLVVLLPLLGLALMIGPLIKPRYDALGYNLGLTLVGAVLLVSSLAALLSVLGEIRHASRALTES